MNVECVINCFDNKTCINFVLFCQAYSSTAVQWKAAHWKTTGSKQINVLWQVYCLNAVSHIYCMWNVWEMHFLQERKTSCLLCNTGISIISNFMLTSSSQSSVNLVSWSTKLPWKIKLWTIDSFLCFWVYFELFRRQQCCRQSNCVFWGCCVGFSECSVLSFIIEPYFSCSLWSVS